MWRRGKIQHKVVRVPKTWEKYLDSLGCPSAGPNGNAEGMKRLWWGLDAYVVKCGAYLYNVGETEYRRLVYGEIGKREVA